MKSEEKGGPFLELFASALQEDYRFPLMEIFVGLYSLSTFALTAVFFGDLSTVTSAGPAFNLVDLASGTPLLIFMILVFKNVAFGVGGDLERGTLQTLLSYPIKRRAVISAKLLSAIVFPLTIFIVLQILGLSVLVPIIFTSQPQVVALAYVSAVCFPLILAAAILMITLFVRRGSVALIVGVVLYFAASILQGFVTFLAFVTNSSLALRIMAIFNPLIAVSAYYNAIRGPGSSALTIWSPSLVEVYSFILAGYILLVALLVLNYYISIGGWAYEKNHLLGRTNRE